jgi:hypothetical protein
MEHPFRISHATSDPTFHIPIPLQSAELTLQNDRARKVTTVRGNSECLQDSNEL